MSGATERFTARRSTPTRSDYDELPEAIRAWITRKEWLWLSDREKATYVQEATEPEVE